jgi:hypothetical protein
MFTYKSASDKTEPFGKEEGKQKAANKEHRTAGG